MHCAGLAPTEYVSESCTSMVCRVSCTIDLLVTRKANIASRFYIVESVIIFPFSLNVYMLAKVIPSSPQKQHYGCIHSYHMKFHESTLNSFICRMSANFTLVKKERNASARVVPSASVLMGVTQMTLEFVVMCTATCVTVDKLLLDLSCRVMEH